MYIAINISHPDSKGVYSFIWPYSLMKFTQNIHPPRLFGPTRLIGT